jgi:hypothetical protein
VIHSQSLRSSNIARGTGDGRWRHEHLGASMKSSACSTEEKITLRVAILESLPAIVGTAFFFAGALESRLHHFDAHPIIFREPTYVERVGDTASLTVYTALYLGAAFGPFLLPFASYEAFRLTRAVGGRSRSAICAWTFVALGVIAAAVFWGWLSNLDLFI